jgi:hypothetical protein
VDKVAAVNAPLPHDIAAMEGAPLWWRQQPMPDTMTREQYEREAIASSQSPDEPGYSFEETK